MLVMAPEGTTGDGRCILQFRTGAFVPGVPVLPVCLSYGKRCHNPAWTIVNEPWHFVRAPSTSKHAIFLEWSSHAGGAAHIRAAVDISMHTCARPSGGQQARC